VLAYKIAEVGAAQTVPPVLASANAGESTAQSHVDGDRLSVGDILLGLDGFLAMRHLPRGTDRAQCHQGRRQTSGGWKCGERLSVFGMR